MKTFPIGRNSSIYSVDAICKRKLPPLEPSQLLTAHAMFARFAFFFSHFLLFASFHSVPFELRFIRALFRSIPFESSSDSHSIRILMPLRCLTICSLKKYKFYYSIV